MSARSIAERRDALRLLLFGPLCQSLASCTAQAAPFASSTPAADAAEIAKIVDEEIAKGRLPGAVVILGVGDKVVMRRAFGDRRLKPSRQPATVDTIYDAASLTKVVATAIAIQQLTERRQIDLDKPAATYWPAFASNGKGAITVRQLLTHYAGLPSGISTSGWSGREGALAIIAALKPSVPAGAHFVYSDIDFIVLGELVRRVSGQTLEAYVSEHIFQPLGMHDTSYLPAPALRERIAPADYEADGLRWGEVQDPIAHRMGGVAGHAGVFTTADDLARLARMMLGSPPAGSPAILSPQSIASMTRPQSPMGGSALRGLGWDIDSPYAGFLAPHFSMGSFGHTGYTGTALWLDPSTKTYLIVLSNRLHPDGTGNVLPMLRRTSAVAGQVALKTAQPEHAAPQVLPGIDVLKQEGFRQLVGRRIALITNRAARSMTGQRTVDVLHQAPGLHLVALFSPEHGLDASGEGRIGAERDSATGLSIYSLYGDARRPTDAMLAGIDTLVFDLQDAGTRYFTYATTMAYAMEEAARRRLDFFVLDRPNPITADTVQGPLLDSDLVSFITYLPLPVRHGMTLGELARFFKGEKP
ncbi:MAG TPA: serine hydrolase, partial [Methylomirabilota bacterium]|nr:serine hydrolase [Methylomirabilota bacterium]